MSLKIGILKTNVAESADQWIAACKKKQIEYHVIDLTKNSWFKEITNQAFDFFLLRPAGSLQRFKSAYDERLYIISKVLGFKTFPSYEECLIYENKRLLSYFLKAKKIPHPKTGVFYDYAEACVFLNQTRYPFVAKTNIGAAGTGVVVIKNQKQGLRYLKKAFKGGGVRRSFGPNRVTGSPKKWIKKALLDPKYFKAKLKSYIKRHKDIQQGFVIFQEFITHRFEWRVMKIGESYFAYKKLAYKGKASGVKNREFVDPPKALLNFVRGICIVNGFESMAFDIFDNQNNYLVNELQTIWGNTADPITKSFHRLEVNGVPGRYVFKNENWVFEKGDFNTNESYDLRLSVALKLYSNNSNNVS